MNIKKFFFRIYVAFLCVACGFFMLRTINLPTDLLYLFIVLLIICILLSLTDNLIKFLTLPRKFPVRFIAGALLVAAGISISKFIANNVQVLPTVIQPIDLGFLTTHKINLDTTASLIFLSLVVSLIYTIFFELNSNE